MIYNVILGIILYTIISNNNNRLIERLSKKELIIGFKSILDIGKNIDIIINIYNYIFKYFIIFFWYLNIIFNNFIFLIYTKYNYENTFLILNKDLILLLN